MDLKARIGLVNLESEFRGAFGFGFEISELAVQTFAFAGT
jgi:hypothetical protein